MTETSKLIVRDAQRPLRRARPISSAARRRTSGALRGAALSRGLRRHRRRRPGQQPDPPDVRVPAFVDRDARQGRQADHPAGQAGAADQGVDRGVRRDRRAEGRHHRRSAPLPLRSGQAALQRRRRADLPDRGAGRVGEEDLRRREEPAHRRADLHRLDARQRRLRRGAGTELARLHHGPGRADARRLLQVLAVPRSELGLPLDRLGTRPRLRRAEAAVHGRGRQGSRRRSRSTAASC